MSFAAPALAQSGAFTYEGRLAEHDAPANGTYELEFTLWDSASGGQPVTAATLGTPGGITVTAGRFAVVLDFGAGALNGQPRWIELAVRARGSTAPFTVIAPRQSLPVAPHAVFATVAGGAADGTIHTAALAANAVTAPKIAAGQVVKGINNLQDAVTLQAGPNVRLNTRGNTITISAPAAPDTNQPAWSLTGNAGTDATNFLGTTDGQPLELRVNNTRALRLELNALGRPNLIGGNTNNRAAAALTGVVIAGGVSNSVEQAANYATIAGGVGNAIGGNSPAAVVSGGRDNAIRTNATMAVVAGGQRNVIQDGAANSAISGGTRNTIGINATNAAILGGSSTPFPTTPALRPSSAARATSPPAAPASPPAPAPRPCTTALSFGLTRVRPPSPAPAAISFSSAPLAAWASAPTNPPAPCMFSAPSPPRASPAAARAFPISVFRRRVFSAS